MPEGTFVGRAWRKLSQTNVSVNLSSVELVLRLVNTIKTRKCSVSTARVDRSGDFYAASVSSKMALRHEGRKISQQ